MHKGKDEMSDVAERVKKIVVEHLGVEADKVVDSANFIDDLGANSLDTVELVMAFEEEFGVEIPDDQAETIVTVGDAVKYLDKASAKKVAADRAEPAVAPAFVQTQFLFNVRAGVSVRPLLRWARRRVAKRNADGSS